MHKRGNEKEMPLSDANSVMHPQAFLRIHYAATTDLPETRNEGAGDRSAHHDPALQKQWT